MLSLILAEWHRDDIERLDLVICSRAISDIVGRNFLKSKAAFILRFAARSFDLPKADLSVIGDKQQGKFFAVNDNPAGMPHTSQSLIPIFEAKFGTIRKLTKVYRWRYSTVHESINKKNSFGISLHAVIDGVVQGMTGHIVFPGVAILKRVQPISPDVNIKMKIPSLK